MPCRYWVRGCVLTGRDSEEKRGVSSSGFWGLTGVKGPSHPVREHGSRKAARLASLLAAISILCLLSSCTHGPAPQPPSFIAVYGDSRHDHETHQEVVDAMRQTDPAVVFHTGDIVDDGENADDWAAFNEVVSELVKTAEFFPSLGNHDYPPDLYFDNFELPNNEQWYSVERNGIHFIVLDTNDDFDPDSEQYEWLESDLQSIDNSIRFTIAVFHHPPFSTGHHGPDDEVREMLVPLFETYGVDVVFSGHDHVYERSLCNGIYYIVTGGGGASLYDQEHTSPYSQVFISTYHFCRLTVAGGQLTVDVFERDLNRIDRFKVTSD